MRNVTAQIDYQPINQIEESEDIENRNTGSVSLYNGSKLAPNYDQNTVQTELNAIHVNTNNRFHDFIKVSFGIELIYKLEVLLIQHEQKIAKAFTYVPQHDHSKFEITKFKYPKSSQIIDEEIVENLPVIEIIQKYKENEIKRLDSTERTTLEKQMTKLATFEVSERLLILNSKDRLASLVEEKQQNDNNNSASYDSNKSIHFGSVGNYGQT